MSQAPIRATGTDVPTVFILSWQRPLYLWACLDALHRHTRHPCRFVIADNASADPLVAEVIRGFERRGMFHEVEWGTRNDAARMPSLIARYWNDIGEYLAYVESDTVVPEATPCWLERMLAHMRTDPRLGLLGSLVDRRDFVSMEHARALHPEAADEDLVFLTKQRAPERGEYDRSAPLVEPHNPAGRLLLFRKAAYADVGFATDSLMHAAMKRSGWRSKIASDVVHRHLSLLNVFDYPAYDRADRDAFFRRVAQGADASATDAPPAPPSQAEG